MKQNHVIVFVAACAIFLLAEQGRGQRIIVSLDGTWQIEDSVSADDIPKSFKHKVPVW